ERPTSRFHPPHRGDGGEHALHHLQHVANLLDCESLSVWYAHLPDSARDRCDARPCVGYRRPGRTN
ncbi:hypothetical protein AAVH_42674, partial [Aphelenchoides avenae]